MDDKNELEAWRKEWRTADENPQKQANKIPSQQARSNMLRRRPFHLFIIALFVVGGLSLLAYWPGKMDRTHALFALIITFSLGALFVGGSGSKPGSVLQSPESYVRSRRSTKSKDLQRVRVALWIAIVSMAISSLALLGSISSPIFGGVIQGSTLPVAALSTATITAGVLAMIRLKRYRELKSLREIELQFDAMDSSSMEGGGAIETRPPQDVFPASLKFGTGRERFGARKKI